MAPDIIFSSESVRAGHPDKLCDQISDSVVDAFLRQDAGARVAIECAISTGVVFLAARFASEAAIDLPSLARGVIESAGYRDTEFDARKCSILTSLTELPLSLREPPAADQDAASIDARPAQEQVNAFGYACRETPELMPLPIALAHRLARALDAAAEARAPWLSPDGKTQVAVEYQNHRPRRIHTVSLTVPMSGGARGDEVSEVLRALALEALEDSEIKPDAATIIRINAGMPYEAGGPARHAGLTGRKGGVDSYGEIARHSGAALSGKDPSRIDRIGAYAARHAAKTVVAAGLAERCEVHLAYTIGQARPLSIAVDSFGTGRATDEAIARRIAHALDFRPAAISHRFSLRERPALAGEAGFYRKLAVYGHFGRTDLDLPWEANDAVEALLG